MQRAPDIDPRLSTGATKLRKKRLDNLPWDHSGKHPGNAIFWKAILLMLGVAMRYIFRRKQIEKNSEYEGGRILSSMHVNGLVDPMLLTLSQDSRIISMGRHDIMTMPLVGWFARRMGSQPVIRRPEIASGVANEDYAKEINDRTLLTMTNCLASGYNALVMPEGKSHQDSRPHRFKTGPMRFAVNAAALARNRGNPLPALQPVGLHYRCHYLFRTDIFVELSDPIPVRPPNEKEIGNIISAGSWVEPPAEQVNLLRDKLFEEVSNVTPNAPSWEIYRAWHLIAHLRAQESGRHLQSFKDEVLAAREVREAIAGRQDYEAITQSAAEAAEILQSYNLDGRSINDGKVRIGKEFGKGLIGAFLMTLVSPISIPSTGLQAFFAWYFGDRTDEGIDARTTYHMLAAMFSPVIFWPPIALIASLAIAPLSLLTPAICLIIMFVFHFSNIIFLFGYDLVSDYYDSVKRTNLAKSKQGKILEKLIEQTRSNLNLL